MNFKNSQPTKAAYFFKLLLCLVFFSSLSGFCSLSFAAAFQIRDDSGQILHFKQHPQRIISLAPHITEIIFYIDQGEKLVGVDQFSNFPEQTLHTPRIGNSAQLNLEEVLKLKPDLVIAWQSGNTAPQITRLADFGIPIYYSEPKHLHDIHHSILQFGLLTGAQAQAKKQAELFEKKMLAFKQQTENNNASEKVRVFYQVWQEPLMTLNGEHIVSEVITLCGGENVFSDLNIIAPQINREAVIEANPQLIITGEQNSESFTMWQAWPNIEAVKHKQFLTVNADHLVRAGPRILLGAEKICAAIRNIRESDSQ